MKNRLSITAFIGGKEPGSRKFGDVSPFQILVFRCSGGQKIDFERTRKTGTRWRSGWSHARRITALRQEKGSRRQPVCAL